MSENMKYHLILIPNLAEKLIFQIIYLSTFTGNLGQIWSETLSFSPILVWSFWLCPTVRRLSSNSGGWGGPLQNISSCKKKNKAETLSFSLILGWSFPQKSPLIDQWVLPQVSSSFISQKRPRWCWAGVEKKRFRGYWLIFI